MWVKRFLLSHCFVQYFLTFAFCLFLLQIKLYTIKQQRPCPYSDSIRQTCSIDCACLSARSDSCQHDSQCYGAKMCPVNASACIDKNLHRRRLGYGGRRYTQARIYAKTVCERGLLGLEYKIYRNIYSNRFLLNMIQSDIF